MYDDRFQLEWLDAVDDAEWSDLLAADARSTPFQRARFWRDFVSCFHGVEARWIEVRDRDRRLVAGMPLAEHRRLGFVRRVSGMEGGYGGPVCRPDHPDAESVLALEFSRSSWRVLMRELVWPRCERPRGSWRSMRPLPTATVVVDPDRDFDSFLRELLPRSRRVEGERSDRRGMTFELESQGRSLAEFHRIYEDRAREWGTPAVPLEALEVVFEHVAEAMLFVVRGPEGAVVGAHLCVDLGDELFAWLGTSERRRDVFAPAVLVREELRWCHRNRRPRLNLGTSGQSEGVQAYKDMVGATDLPRWIVREDRRFWKRGSA